MVVVVTSIPVAADCVDEARSLVGAFVAESRVEPGVIRCWGMLDLDDERTYRIFEQYVDEHAWEAHGETDHYETFREQLREVVAGPIETINIMEENGVHVQRFRAEKF